MIHCCFPEHLGIYIESAGRAEKTQNKNADLFSSENVVQYRLKFPSLSVCLLFKASQNCKVFVMVISSTLHVNEN